MRISLLEGSFLERIVKSNLDGHRMATKEQNQWIVQFRCSSCNASYPLGADDVITTCPYCGFTFTIDGAELTEHLIVPNTVDADQVKKTVLDWLSFAASRSVGKGIINGIEMEEPILQWIPLFRIKGLTAAYHLGYNEKDNRFRKIESTKREISRIWILARRHAGTFGINEFVTNLEFAEPVPFNITQVEAPILNAEISEKDARSRASYIKSERDRRILQESMDKLLDYRLNLEITNCDYVHVPYWLSRYEYNGGTFRVAFSGSSGRVVLGELPVTKRYRIFKWLSSIILLAGSTLLFQALPYLVYFTQGAADDAVYIPILTGAIAIFLFAISYIEMGEVLKYELRINAEGDEQDSVSINDKLKSFWRKVT